MDATRMSEDNDQYDEPAASCNALMARAMEAMRSGVDAVPRGFLTVQQYADHFRISRQTAQRQLRAGHERGTIERRAFRITTGSVCRPVPHFRAI